MAAALDGERNFRSHYYEKVGFKGVEEKKSLQILLKDDPLDDDKLQTFCLRFPVPAIHRCYLWKVVLGVLPLQQTTHEFVAEQKRQQFEDLWRALEVMKVIDRNTQLPLAFLRMQQLNTGQLPMPEHQEREDREWHPFASIATAVLEMADSELDAFWITVEVYRVYGKFKDLLPKLVDRFLQFLEKEDQELYQHLAMHNVLYLIPTQAWLADMFAASLPPSSLTRVWDKVVGGSCMILVFVALAILLTYRRNLIASHHSSTITRFLEGFPQENSDMIVSKALELWEKNGSALKPE